MKYRSLGKTGLNVSLICLGSMTWGEQNSEPEAHAQLDMARDFGINFVDTAEMYPVPPKAETQGLTELYLGNWLKKQKKRADWIIASKVVGRSSGFTYIRGGETRLNKEQIHAALDASLKRLSTDYIDLYQLHWPERQTNYFGALGYRHVEETDIIPLEETLEVLQAIVLSGKVRHIGLSNETPWGTMRAIFSSENRGLPRPVSIQNPYNLLNRSFEVGLSEIAIREECGLLAYSPLAFGALTGKYLNGQKPPKGRLTLYERFGRYRGEVAEKAIGRYVEIARKHGLDPAQMALAFVNRQKFVTANIIGATTLEQLKANIESVHVELSDAVLQEIESVHRTISNPCP